MMFLYFYATLCNLLKMVKTESNFGQKSGQKSDFWGRFLRTFWGFFEVFGVGRGSPKSGKIVIFGQNRGFGDGLDLSLNAKNHANFRSFFAKRGGHFRAFREPIYTILSAAAVAIRGYGTSSSRPSRTNWEPSKSAKFPWFLCRKLTSILAEDPAIFLRYFYLFSCQIFLFLFYFFNIFYKILVFLWNFWFFLRIPCFS
jgi:hypothetical protein